MELTQVYMLSMAVTIETGLIAQVTFDCRPILCHEI